MKNHREPGDSHIREPGRDKLEKFTVGETIIVQIDDRENPRAWIQSDRVMINVP